MKASWLALFEEIATGKIAPQEALKMLPGLTMRELEEATLDLQRAVRQDFPEVIFAQGKRPEVCAALFAELADRGPVLCTRADAATAQAVLEKTPGVRYNARAQTLVWQQGAPSPTWGRVLVMTAGTADLPWAEEAVETLRFMGNRTELLPDVGVAGLHRLLAHREQLLNARVVIVAAGMDGALPSVVGGLVHAPVIGLPTPIGYGSGSQGRAALLTMLNSCAAGIGVVNVGNGFGAAVLASRINHLGPKEAEG